MFRPNALWPLLPIRSDGRRVTSACTAGRQAGDTGGKQAVSDFVVCQAAA